MEIYREWNDLSQDLITHQLLITTPINLHKLNYHDFSVEMELFPAAKFRHDGHEHVNVFSNGKVVITGVRNLTRAEVLVQQVMSTL